MEYYEKLQKQGYYLIAEIGVNYYDIAAQRNITPIDAAKLMMEEAKNAGIDAVKFQSYKADTLASKYSPSYWDTSEENATSQYELFQKFDSFGKTEYIELAEYAKEIEVDFLSTPFDIDSVDYLYPYMGVYKISSSDLTNLPFITYISKKNKPILLSVGASNEDEIERAVETIKKFDDKQITLLHCVLEYPTPYEHANLAKIITLKEKYNDCIIGYSDHTRPDMHMDVVKNAYLYGATVIEKHFTLDKTLKGNDHYHAMDSNDLKTLKQGMEFLKKIRGEKTLKALETESLARMNARRSIVTKKAIKKGEIIKEEMLTFKRPALGISPNRWDEIIGKKACVDIEEDMPLQDEMLQ